MVEAGSVLTRTGRPERWGIVEIWSMSGSMTEDQ